MAEDGDIHDYVRTEVRNGMADLKEWFNERLKVVDQVAAGVTEAKVAANKAQADLATCQTTCKGRIDAMEARQKLVMALCTTLGGIGGSILTYAAVFLLEKHL
jgi:hypothetical protein